jgi:alanine dehydrogenase
VTSMRNARSSDRPSRSTSNLTSAPTGPVCWSGLTGSAGSRGASVIVGVPKEVKDNEFRVALTPEGARELTHAGHRVLVQDGAGDGSSLPQQRYERAGAEIVPTAKDVWTAADMILKVKEPVPDEYDLMQEGQVLFTYLHLAAGKELTEALLERKVAGVAYETVQIADGRLPLLAPMSEVAGRMAPHVGARLQEKEYGGRGILMGGVSGVRPAKVLVLGAGMAGTNAAWIAAGMEAEVTVVDKNLDKLRFIDQVMRGRIVTLASDRLTLEQRVRESDIVIGTVLVPGARAPKLITTEMVESMRPGSVIIDISIDQGGSVETSHMTTHSDPTYVVSGVVHYAVGNMPGAVPNTSTYALTNVTLPYAIAIAESGMDEAMRADPALARGLNSYGGALTNRAVAEAHGLEWTPVSSVVSGAAE